MMNYRLLGHSGLRVSEYSLGTMTFGEDWGWGSAKDEAKRIYDAYREAGGNFIDTANLYTNGASERILGELLQGHRDEVVLATKFTNAAPGKDPNAGGNHRKNMMQAVEASLNRLKTGYIDLYWLHIWDQITPVEEVMRAFDDLVRQGKALYIGVSEWRAEEIASALRIADEMGLDRIVSNQPQYNMIWRVIEPEVVPLCEKEGIGQIVWSPIAQGALTGKYLPGEAPPANSRATDSRGSVFIADYLSDDILRRAQNLRSVADEAGLTLSQLAVAWTLQNPNVS
ncbi:MAG TPA: aldo/keto reductase, partial [Candidatus Sulfopaludibacter sp.]|nr:aldo/keto reductase [Candidatus Sulfopaludibacter sp.]